MIGAGVHGGDHPMDGKAGELLAGFGSLAPR